MNVKVDEYNYMKKGAIAFVMGQLKLRGENVVLASRLDRHDILIKDKDIKIKVKFGKLTRRSKCVDHKWEFRKVMHNSRLWPKDTFDFYILVGFDENGGIKKLWKISSDDKIIYRKNQVFIRVDDNEKYKDHELKIYDCPMSEEFQWID